MKEESILSGELICELNMKHIYFLYQASHPFSFSLLGQNWVNSIELGLEGDLGCEWENYRNHLLHAGIVLNEKTDELTWLGDDKSGLISVRNVYNTLSNNF
jgi:hypothetical protein